MFHQQIETKHEYIAALFRTFLSAKRQRRALVSIQNGKITLVRKKVTLGKFLVQHGASYYEKRCQRASFLQLTVMRP